MRGHTDGVGGVAFFNDGHRVVTGSRDKTLRIWNAQRGMLLGEPLQGHQESVLSVAVSPDDRRVASGGQDNIVIIWDVERKQIVFKLKHKESVNCVCFSPDGKRLASGSNDGTAAIWDTMTGSVLTALVVQGVWMLSVAFSPDGLKLASGALDGIIRVCQTGKATYILLKFKAHEFGACGIAWSPDGQQLISASWDKKVKFWNSSTGRQIGQPCTDGRTDCIRSLAIASDGSFIATASDDKTVRLWSTKTYQQMGQPLEHPNKVLRIAISADGALLASGTENENLYLWSVGNTLQRRDGQEGYEEELEVEQQPRISEIVSLHLPSHLMWSDLNRKCCRCPPSEVSISSQRLNDSQVRSFCPVSV